MIPGLDADTEWRNCEFCLSFDTGPVQTRQSEYAPGEGHSIDPVGWPFAQVVQLDDGWLAVWDQGAHDEEHQYLLCPYHARNEHVPRPQEFARVGDVEVSLQEFDYIGTRPPDIVMFKHLVTKRYLNLAERDGSVVSCDHGCGSGVVEHDVGEGFQQAQT